MSFFVNQTSLNDCGAACLTMILRLNKVKININEVKKKLKIQQLIKVILRRLLLIRMEHIEENDYE